MILLRNVNSTFSRLDRRSFLALAAAAGAGPDGAGARTESWKLQLGAGEREAAARLQPLRREQGARDPRLRQAYSHALSLQVRETASYRTRFNIYLQDPADEALAACAARPLSWLYHLVTSRLGRPHPAAPLPVYLRRSAEAGAEEYQGAIYLHGVQVERTPLEWLRELAHEYGHVVLPAFGPFARPEPAAAGYLGERLFLKALLLDYQAPDLWPGLAPSEIESFRLTKIRGPLLDPLGADVEPMEVFITRMLRVEACYGSALLSRLLARYRDRRPEHVELFLGEALGEAAVQAPPRVHAALGSDIWWVLSPPGRWRLRFAAASGEAELRDTLSGEPLPARSEGAGLSFALTGAPGAWMRLQSRGLPAAAVQFPSS